MTTVLLAGPNDLTVIRGNAQRLDVCVRGPVNWPDSQNAGRMLSEVLPASQRKAMGDIWLVLPRSIFFSKMVYFPTIDEQEIKKMAALQISQHLPYDEEQAVWDIVVCQRRGNSSDVMILAIQREKIMTYLKVLETQGLTPSVITVSSCVLAALSAVQNPDGPMALLVPGEQSTEICFCAAGKFYYSRSMAFGTKDFHGRTEDMATQVRLTFEAHHKNFFVDGAFDGLCLFDATESVPPAVLEPSGIVWKNFEPESFRKKFGIFSISKNVSVLPEAWAGIAAIRKGTAEFCNFLPADHRERHKVMAGKKNLIVFSCLVIGVLLSLTFAYGAPIIKKNQYVRSLKDQLRMVQSPFLKARNEKALWIALERRMNEHLPALELIDGLYQVLQPGISFSRIRVSGQNDLSLEGLALQSSLINDFQEKMISANVFRDVHLEHSVRRTGINGEVIQFVITSKLRAPSTEKSE